MKFFLCGRQKEEYVDRLQAASTYCTTLVYGPYSSSREAGAVLRDKVSYKWKLEKTWTILQGSVCPLSPRNKSPRRNDSNRSSSNNKWGGERSLWVLISPDFNTVYGPFGYNRADQVNNQLHNDKWLILFCSSGPVKVSLF